MKGNPIKKAVTKVSRDMMSFLENEFQDYEIECIIAELELNIPLPLSQAGKGSLKVTMKKKKSNNEP